VKIDRLIGITMYLLNRGVVTSKELAERFEVSVRTIVRDMEALSLAGIPVASSAGASGGYEILDTFKLNKQITTLDDYLFIITAMKGMYSAYENKKINAALEKLLAVGHYTDEEQRVFIDLGVAKEGVNISKYVREIENAIRDKVIIDFNYNDASGRQHARSVEPLALQYRWYGWYLLAFCTYKNDYRFFKLNRVSNLSVTGVPINQNHGNIPELLERIWSSDNRRIFKIKLLCKAEVRIPVMEYLKGQIIEECENNDFIMEMQAPENERMWFSLIMGFGGAVKVLEPQEIIDMLNEKTKEICELYNNQ